MTSDAVHVITTLGPTDEPGPGVDCVLERSPYFTREDLVFDYDVPDPADQPKTLLFTYDEHGYHPWRQR